MLNAGAHDLPLANLSSREMQILVLIGKGKPYDEIAEILTLNYRSVVNATATLRSKLGVGSMAELMQIAASQARTRP
jgi:DNA-binding CsgD family transcriptional regulator